MFKVFGSRLVATSRLGGGKSCRSQPGGTLQSRRKEDREKVSNKCLRTAVFFPPNRVVYWERKSHGNNLFPKSLHQQIEILWQDIHYTKKLSGVRHKQRIAMYSPFIIFSNLKVRDYSDVLMRRKKKLRLLQCVPVHVFISFSLLCYETYFRTYTKYQRFYAIIFRGNLWAFSGQFSIPGFGTAI